MPAILGQTQAVHILGEALRAGRVHHAWIFSGPKGVGKFTAAMHFAGVILDPDLSLGRAMALDPDSSTPTARSIAAGIHPDLHIIRKELARESDDPEVRKKLLTNIPIDVLRENMIGDRTHDAPAYRSASGPRGKVFIIDEAELIDDTGQNALLKTLEEPPAKTYIILVTSRTDRLLPTIRSRCQHVRFAPLDGESMGRWMRAAGSAALDAVDALAAEASEDSSDQKPMSNGQPREIVLAWTEQFADGSPGTAQLAIDYGFHDWHIALSPMLAELATGRFPLAMGATMAGMVDDFALRWVGRHDNASKDAANKDGMRNLLCILAGDARRNLRQCAERGQDASRWLDIIDLLRDAESQMNANVNLKLLLENLAAQWARRAAA